MASWASVIGTAMISLASAIGANYRVIDNGVNGFLAKNYNDWINSIDILCKNFSLREKMGKNARDKVVKNFSIEY